LAKQYVGIKFGFENANFAASSANERRDSMPYDEAKAAINHNSMLIYLSQDIEPASLVADITRFWRPDMIIEAGSGYNWNDDSELQKIRQRNQVLKPRLGTFIAVKSGAVKPGTQDIGNDVSILDIDSDALELKPVIDKLLS
jgi:Ethanolamine utilization protein EutJ (predicted chaperonin)